MNSQKGETKYQRINRDGSTPKVLNVSRDSNDFKASFTSNSILEPVKEEIDKHGSSLRKFFGVFILLGAIIGGSSIGTLANFIPVETSFAKNAWRSGLIVIMFTPPALIEYYNNRGRVNYATLLNWKQYGFLLLTLTCQVLWTFGLIYASLNTI